jgi:ribosome-binding ATPase
MRVGLVGFSGSGKTTVFRALTGLATSPGSAARGAISIGMIKIPDERIDFLARVYDTKRTVFAEIGFVDVAGPPPENAGHGLDAMLVQAMRDADALAHIVGAYASNDIASDEGVAREVASFAAELVLTDMMQVDKRLERVRKEGAKAGHPERDLLERLYAHLEEGHALRTLSLTEDQWKRLAGYHFLSQKPCLVVLNVAGAAASASVPAAVQQQADAHAMPVMVLAGEAEAEIGELEPAEQTAFLSDLGLDAPARTRFITASYRELDLISFLTSGPDECRAWSIKRGTRAREAAGKIHTDIERGFIRAEVIAYTDFHAHPSEAECRQHGKLRLEGKEYVVQDGDIVTFRFNV